MKMSSVNAVAVCVTSVVLSLLIMAEPSHQQVAWRPQGRFGKRDFMDSRLSNDLISSKLREIQDQTEQNMAKDWKILSVPHFESDGILCIESEDDYRQKGLYRCFTLNPNPHSNTPISQLTNTFIQLDDVFCVISGERGIYKCLTTRGR